MVDDGPDLQLPVNLRPSELLQFHLLDRQEGGWWLAVPGQARPIPCPRQARRAPAPGADPTEAETQLKNPVGPGWCLEQGTAGAEGQACRLLCPARQACLHLPGTKGHSRWAAPPGRRGVVPEQGPGRKGRTPSPKTKFKGTKSVCQAEGGRALVLPAARLRRHRLPSHPLCVVEVPSPFPVRLVSQLLCYGSEMVSGHGPAWSTQAGRLSPALWWLWHECGCSAAQI